MHQGRPDPIPLDNEVVTCHFLDALLVEIEKPGILNGYGDIMDRLHRVAFHYPAKSKFGKKFVWYSHGVHHDWPNDKMRLVFPPAISIPLALLFFWLYTLAFGEAGRYAPFAGLAFGYLAYDMIHYATHHFSWDNAVMKYLRAYHMAHHFKHEPTRYGVSNPMWDYVFGTAPKRG